MSIPFTDPNTVDRLNSRILADEIERAYIERTTLDLAGDVDTSDFIVNDMDMWSRWQGLYTHFLDEITIATPIYCIDILPPDASYDSMAHVMQVAGLPYSNFRAYTTHPNEGGSPEYRMARKGDITGIWLWEDLQAMMSVLSIKGVQWGLAQEQTKQTYRSTYTWCGTKLDEAETKYNDGDFWWSYTNAQYLSSRSGTGCGSRCAAFGYRKISSVISRNKYDWYAHNESAFAAEALCYALVSKDGRYKYDILGVYWYDTYNAWGDHAFSDRTFNFVGSGPVSAGSTSYICSLGNISDPAPRSDGNEGYFLSFPSVYLKYDFTNSNI
ncbi:MAG: hypothetical protein B6244_14310 [Candidatus Cloacimonetes bacterium 4572_55]|nr:MAG: hypothetical protein B6244_14310 [Candidatus Cloacimonetes bacterium 4572_55]